jgi:hypothetical protein
MGVASSFWQLIGLAQLFLLVWSGIHLFKTRPDAFVAANKQTKKFWAIVIAAGLFLGYFKILMLIPLIAALIYLLDVRPAVEEVQRGPRW